MDSITTSDFNKICRLCLCTNNQLTSIIETILPVRIMDCVSLEVSAVDEKPKLICVQCLEQITAWYSFKQMCKKSDSLLEKYIREKNAPMIVPEPVVECVVKLKHVQSFATWDDASEADGADNSLSEPEPNEEKCYDINTPLGLTNNDESASTSQLGFQCKTCNISFEDDLFLSNHNRIVHPINKVFDCYFCGDLSESSIALIQHERTHRPDSKRKTVEKKKLQTCRRKSKRKRSKPKKFSSSDSEQAECDVETKTVAEENDKAVNSDSNKHIEQDPEAADIEPEGADIEPEGADIEPEGADIEPEGADIVPEGAEPVHNRKGKQVCLVCGKKFLCMAVLVTHERRVHLGEPIFQCQHCGKCYTTKRTLLTHMGSHEPEKHHKCDVCDKTFTHTTLMSQHKVLVHSAVKPFKCSYCPKSFIRRYMLKTHQVVHTKEKAFNCEHCHKDFSRRESLKVHMRFHSEHPVPKYVPPRRYMCTLCGKDYISPGELNRHELVTHKGERPYKCDQCDKAYASKFSLQVHQAIHTTERNHICEVCGKCFNHSTRLSQHKALVHHNGKPFKCIICEKSFLKPSLLKKHQVVHTGERCETCHKCDKTFGTREGLKQHLLTHSEVKRFSCDTCGKRFAVNKSLKAHTCDGTPFVDLEKNIPCPTCGKMFISKKTLSRHMTKQRCDNKFGTPEAVAEHLKAIPEVKRFVCDFCGRRYISNSQLQTHRCPSLLPPPAPRPEVEKPEKVHNCPTCGKKFSSKSWLRKHITMQSCSVSDLVFAAMSM